MQLSLAVTLCFTSTLLPLIMQWTKLRNGGEVPFHTPTAVLYTEALKAVVATTVYAIQLPMLEYTGLEDFSARATLVYALPALLFSIQNNASYYALSLIDPPTFELWGCSKLIFVGVFFRVIFGRQLTPRKWLALGLLAAGVAISTVQLGAGKAHAPPRPQQLGGIAVVVLSSALAGLSSIIFEYLIKFQDVKAPLMLKNAQLYAFGVALSAPGWRPTAPLGDPMCFTLLVVLQALAGLFVSLVLKYCDALVKGFSTSSAVLVATLASNLLFGFELHANFAAAIAVVFTAFYLYFVTPDASSYSFLSC